MNFYPRSPCGERPTHFMPNIGTLHFYPRSPCGERHLSICVIELIEHFYPRSPCGERQYLVRGQRPNWEISIHALLAESDWLELFLYYQDNRFLSTLSLRRATIYTHPVTIFIRISIHALLAESDVASVLAVSRARYFYPRSPCGERRGSKTHDRHKTPISIHALLAESDPPVRGIVQWEGIFLSTLSLRRATLNLPSRPIDKKISIHALLAESDEPKPEAYSSEPDISIHALLAESDKSLSA